MPANQSLSRRGFLGTSAMTLAMGQLFLACSAAAQGSSPGPFGTIKQIHAGVLDVGYVEMGPADGIPVILLHGWPYDIHSFTEVAPILASARCRVLVPFLRGFGSTR